MDVTLRRLLREPANHREPICPRCSRPITPGTASQFAGWPVHMRCLARATQLASLEGRDSARAVNDRAQRLVARAAALVAEARAFQRDCLVCKHPPSQGGSLLFQGDVLVHATCWRGDLTPRDAPPPTA